MIRIQFMERTGLCNNKVTFIGVPYRLVSYTRHITKDPEQIEHTYDIGVPHDPCNIDLKPTGSQAVIYLEDGKARVAVFDSKNPPADSWLKKKLEAVKVKDRDYLNVWTS